MGGGGGGLGGGLEHGRGVAVANFSFFSFLLYGKRKRRQARYCGCDDVMR